MPSNLTAAVVEDLDKPMPTTKDFIMRIARGTAWMMHMREESFDEPVVLLPTENPYREESIRKAKEQLALLETMTEAEAQVEIQARYDEEVLAWQEQREALVIVAERLDEMEKNVRAWRCPEPVKGIKDYALRQLAETRDADLTKPRKWAKDHIPVKPIAKDWIEEQKKFWQSDLEFQEKEKAREDARVEVKNEEIQMFLDSIEDLK